jgi:hypothetical protein
MDPANDPQIQQELDRLRELREEGKSLQEKLRGTMAEHDRLEQLLHGCGPPEPTSGDPSASQTE